MNCLSFIDSLTLSVRQEFNLFSTFNSSVETEESSSYLKELLFRYIVFLSVFLAACLFVLMSLFFYQLQLVLVHSATLSFKLLNVSLLQLELTSMIDLFEDP